MNTHDTIAAPATAIGGAVTIIRISGQKTLEILNTVWQGKKKITSLDARMMLLGKVAGEPALAVFMPGPKSYTGEDVGEIHIHGGPVSASLTLQLLYETGCRAAQAGEFTFRAFINGKLDLTQAEAVADLVSSNSTLARNLANSQLSGSLKRKIDELYE
jgi:tRNA modification GTPase